MAIQIHSSDDSINVNQESSCSFDLTVNNTDTENALLYGGVVTWLQDYDFYVSPAGYYINGIFYESPEAYITLSPADPLLDRFDVIYLDSDQVVKVIEGDPSLTPSEPGLDLGLQLGLSSIFVEAGSSSPVDLVTECMDGWSAFGSDGDIDVASANTCLGLGIEATDGDNGDYALLDRGTSFTVSSTYNVLTFRLKPKSDWSNNPILNHRVSFQFRLAGVNVGSEVIVADTAFNFSTTATGTCQIISIPVIQFSLPTTQQVDQLKVTILANSLDFGFYLDGICLQGGIFGATESDDIHNQYFGPQTPGRFWIEGRARIQGEFTTMDANPLHNLTEKHGLGANVQGAYASLFGGYTTATDYGSAFGYTSNAGTAAVAIGYQASANGGNVAIGYNANATGQSTALGGGTTAGPNNATAVGWNATVSAVGGVAVGWTAKDNFGYGIALGLNAETTAGNQVVFGATQSSSGVRDLYFGNGDRVSTDAGSTGIPATYSWYTSGARGTDVAGSAWRFISSPATGNAAGGTFEWMTSDATASGTTYQSVTTKMALNSSTKGLYLDNIRFQMDEGANVVAANNLTLGTGNTFTITGNTQVNAITNTNWQDGAAIYLVFVGTPTLKHNTSGSAGTSPILLAGEVDFSVDPNTVLSLIYKDSFWREVGRTQSTSAGGILTADNALTLSTGSNVQWGAPDSVTSPLLHDTYVNGDGYNVFFLGGDGFFVSTDNQIQLGSNGDIILASDVDGNLSQITMATSGNVTIAADNNLSLQSSIGTVVDGRFEEDRGANVVAANNLTLGLDGNLFIITGNTQINAITTANWQAGSTIKLEFTGTPTVKHNTVGGAGTVPIYLSGGVDYTAAANDILTLVYDGTNWHETARKSTAVGGTGILSADNGLRLSTATNVQWGGPVSSQPVLLFNTYIDTSGYNVTIGDALTTNAGASRAFNAGKNNNITGGDLNTVFLNNNAVSGNENFVAGRNMVVAGSTNFVAATDGQVFSTANYSATFGDAPINRGIAALTAGFGNKNWAENGFTMGSNNVNGSLSPTVGTANLYSNSTVIGLQNFSLGSVNFVGGYDLTANNATGFITQFGKSYTVTTPNSFNVGYTTNAFEITQNKVRINSARFEEYMGAAVASANDLTVGTDGNVFSITGAVQINAITTANWQAGSTIKLIFVSTPTVKHNTAGGAGTAPILLAGNTDYAVSAGDALSLVYDGTNWHEIGRKPAAGFGISGITANSGLTANTATNVQLGATSAGVNPLLHNTFIDVTSAYTLNITGSNTSNSTGSLYIENTGNGTALYASSYGGATADTHAHPARIEGFFTSTNTVQPVLQVIRSTTIGADGIGGGIEYRVNTAAVGGNHPNSINTRLDAKWVSESANTAQFDIRTKNAGTLNTIASFYGPGVVGIGISSGYTATRLEVQDATGSASPMAQFLSTSSNNTVNILNQNGSGGTGLDVTSDFGTGANISGNDGLPLGVFKIKTTTSTPELIVKLNRNIAGSVNSGDGGMLEYDITTSSGQTQIANQLKSQWTDPTNATRTSKFIITGVTSAATEDWLILGQSGHVQLRSMTATEASAITAAAGMIVFVNNTNGTFTSVGFWGYDGSAWAKF